MSTQTDRATPSWLLQPEVGLCPCGCIGRRRRGSHLDKTIGGAAEVLRRSLIADDLASRDGVIQRLDPRVKLVTFLGLLLVASLVHRIGVLVALYALSLAIGLAAHIPLGFLVKRVWLSVPLFTAVVVIPATFNLVTPGRVVVPLGHWFGHPVGLTSQGLRSAALIVSRVAVSVSLMAVLALTTTWSKLLGALRALGVPAMFVLVLAMAHRYLYHLLATVADMYEARKARTVEPKAGSRAGRAFVTASAGALFGRAHALSEEVHLAMVSRGYTGPVRPPAGRRLARLDLAWTLGALGVAAAALGVDRALGR